SAPRTRPRLAGVGLRAGVAVVAGTAVRFGRVRTDARARVAGSRVMTLIRRRTHHRAAAGAHSRLTGVGLGAGVAVVARRAVGVGRRAVMGRFVARLAAVPVAVGTGTGVARVDAAGTATAGIGPVAEQPVVA